MQGKIETKFENDFDFELDRTAASTSTSRAFH